MAITNLNNTHLTEEQVNAAKDALAHLETALEIIQVNLSSEDRQKYGSINEQNKLLVNKVLDYHKNQSELETPHIDWHEFERDHSSRNNLEAMIARMESMTNRLNNAKILHDYDNYQAALQDYAYTNFMAGTAKPGFEIKMNDLKQLFVKTPNSGSKTEPSV